MGQLVVVQPDDQPSGQHPYGRGYRAGRPYGLFHLAGDVEIVRPRQSLRDDRALQRHDRPAALKRVGHVRTETDGLHDATLNAW